MARTAAQLAQVNGFKPKTRAHFDASEVLKKLQEMQKPPGKHLDIAMSVKLEKLRPQRSWWFLYVFIKCFFFVFILTLKPPQIKRKFLELSRIGSLITGRHQVASLSGSFMVDTRASAASAG